jgi:hypothetical protein
MSQKRAALFEKKYIPEPNSGCWLWTGALTGTGYGQFWIGDRTTVAHRFSYELLVGPIPRGRDLDHKCRIRCCVNPAHLEPVTRAENMRRAAPFGTLGGHHRTKTRCKRGHPFDETNTDHRLGANGKPRRQCRECVRIVGREYWERAGRSRRLQRLGGVL